MLSWKLILKKTNNLNIVDNDCHKFNLPICEKKIAVLINKIRFTLVFWQFSVNNFTGKVILHVQ